MTTITCTRLLEFDAAHRVDKHESKCKYLHGHRYKVEATFSAKELDSLGRIIDFGVIKERLGSWLDANWDHTMVLWEKDKTLGEQVAAYTHQVVYYLPYNPTAENMARYLLEEICPTLFSDADITCSQILIHETPNCYAVAAAD